jgi:calcineurin-like phosphoesterase family protein
MGEGSGGNSGFVALDLLHNGFAHVLRFGPFHVLENAHKIILDLWSNLAGDDDHVFFLALALFRFLHSGGYTKLTQLT